MSLPLSIRTLSMATLKQEITFEKTVENGENITQAMREAGYSEATIHNPSNLTQSKGFIELCEEKGLTDDLLINALVQDINDKKGNRRAELELAFKIKGKLVQKTDITSNLKILQPLDESVKAQIEKAFSLAY